MSTQITGIATTTVIGRIQPHGTHLFRVYGTWDSATANLQYSEDGGATYRDVAATTLLLLADDMDDPVDILVGEGTWWQLEIASPGASTLLALWYAQVGS